MHAFAEGLGALAVALLHRAVVVMVDGLAAFELAANFWVERVIGGVAAGEQGIAAGGGDFHRVEQRSLIGHFGVDHVVMEHHLAIRQRADRLAILADVGDQHDAWQNLGVSLGKEFRRPARHSLLAEIAGNADEVLLGELLSREHDHKVIEPSLVDRLDGVVIGLLAQIDPAQLRADMLGKRADLKPGLGQHVHGLSPTSRRRSLLRHGARLDSRRRSRNFSCAEVSSVTVLVHLT